VGLVTSAILLQMTVKLPSLRARTLERSEGIAALRAPRRADAAALATILDAARVRRVLVVSRQPRLRLRFDPLELRDITTHGRLTIQRWER
jgi:hypothetical protein